jgi:MurNAc alpha-1-phosphate uridylyltransferase
MSALLLLAPKQASLGFDGRGDFFLDPSPSKNTGRLQRRGKAEAAPYIFAGVSILKPELFDGIEKDVFSLNVIFDVAASRGELFGFVLDGLWMHVGSPQALVEAERHLQGLNAKSA